jgi:hypothetical protein
VSVACDCVGQNVTLISKLTAHYLVTGESCHDMLQTGHRGVQVVRPSDKDRKFYPKVRTSPVYKVS